MKHRWSAIFLLALLMATFAGCATTDTENESAQPWNRPKTWETGLPSSILEGR